MNKLEPGLRVQQKMCATCVYRKRSPIDPKSLEERLLTPWGDFSGHRICHSSRTACCHGFWKRHKDKFQAGQLAQRLGAVVWVQDKIATAIGRSVLKLWKEMRDGRRQSAGGRNQRPT